MAKIHSGAFQEVLSEMEVGRNGNFKAIVKYGIEKFNLKKVYKVFVKADFLGCTSKYSYDNFDEAKEEALSLLASEVENFEEAMKKLREINK